MAKNFGYGRVYGGEGKLMAKDLEVGQALYNIGFSSWETGATSLRKVYVMKILKTKIVLSWGSEVSLNSRTVDIRVKDGEVLDTSPGSGYYGSSTNLCTLDDPEVAEAERSIDFKSSKNKARNAANAVSWGNHPTVESIEEMISTAQVYLEKLKEQEYHD